MTEEYEHIRAGLSEVHDSTATSTTQVPYNYAKYMVTTSKTAFTRSLGKGKFTAS